LLNSLLHLRRFMQRLFKLINSRFRLRFLR
jgi:hypothetical protein